MPIICIEGINGSGKTTQAKLLAERITQENARAKSYVLSDPGVCEGHPAMEIRNAARMGKWKHEMTRAFQFISARCELVAEIEEILLDPDAWVVLDRYIPSFCVYQIEDFLTSTYGDMVGAIDAINYLHRMIDAPVPTATFVLDVDPVIGIKRYKQASHDNPDVFERDVNKIYELYHRYKQLIQMWGSFDSLGSVCVVEVDDLSAKAVHEKLWSYWLDGQEILDGQG